jgi:hypothetical protein
MKTRLVLVLGLALSLFANPSLAADPTRAEIIANYHTQWDARWEALHQRILASQAKATLDPAVAKMYKTTINEFLGADATIKQNLASATMDLTGLNSYTDEEYEECTSYIYNVEKAIKSYKTITCIKGTARKVVTNSSPKCPSGYKKK